MDRLIESNSQQVQNKMRKAQRKLENMLAQAQEYAEELDIQRAAQLFEEADRTLISEKLPKKGRIKAKFLQTAQCLRNAESAIEGDMNLDLAWSVIQADELSEAQKYLAEASRCYGDLPMRAQELRRCEQAYEIKRESEQQIRERGDVYMVKAREEIAAFRFDEAAEAADQARRAYCVWLTPVGVFQSLIEKVTMMLEKTWNNRALFDMFCAHDVTNLSGQGSRAYTMDFIEMLHLLRALGILAVKKSLTAPEEQSMTVSMSKAEHQMRQQQLAMVDLCTFDEIRNDPLCKVNKADIHEEFRSVNRQSIQQALHGKDEADADASALDFGEYQLIMLRIGRLLGVAVTDHGCSPLFVPDVREADLLKEEIAAAKKEYIQSLALQGEKIMAQARNQMQDKQFDEARLALERAQIQFMKIKDDSMQRINIAACRRLADQVDREEKKEVARRIEQRVHADQALEHALKMLEEFDQLGSRFDEHLFDTIERETDNARKMFKSAHAYTSDKKSMYLDITRRCQSAREAIVVLRKQVVHGREELDTGKSLLLQYQDLKGTISPQPPFESILAHLCTARECFMRAKVHEDVKEVSDLLRGLVSLSLQWIRIHVDSGETYLRVSDQAMSEAVAAAATDAGLTEDKFSASRNNFKEALKVFERGKAGHVMINFLAEEGDPQAQHPDRYRDRKAESMRAKLEDTELKWRQQREKEVQEAFAEVERSRQCVAKAEFLQAREHLRLAKDLFKKQEADLIKEVTSEIRQAESADKSRANAMREEGMQHMADAAHARTEARYGEALAMVEHSRKCFLTARENALEEAAAKMFSDILQQVRSTYLEQIQDAEFLLEQANSALVGLRFADGTELLGRAYMLLHNESYRGMLNTEESRAVFEDDQDVLAGYVKHEHMKQAVEQMKSLAIREERVHRSTTDLRMHMGAQLARVLDASTEHTVPLTWTLHETTSLRSRCELARALSWKGSQDQQNGAKRDMGATGTDDQPRQLSTATHDVEDTLRRTTELVSACEAQKKEEDGVVLAEIERMLQQASVALGVPQAQSLEWSVDYDTWVAGVVAEAENASQNQDSASEQGGALSNSQHTSAHGVGLPPQSSMENRNASKDSSESRSDDVKTDGIEDRGAKSQVVHDVKDGKNEDGNTSESAVDPDSEKRSKEQTKVLERDAVCANWDADWHMIIFSEYSDGVNEDNKALVKFGYKYEDTGVRELVNAACLTDRVMRRIETLESDATATSVAQAWCAWINQRVQALATGEMNDLLTKLESHLSESQRLAELGLYHSAEKILVETENLRDVPDNVLFAVLTPFESEHKTWLSQVAGLKERATALLESVRRGRDDKVKNLRAQSSALIAEAESYGGMAEFGEANVRLEKALAMLKEEMVRMNDCV